MLITNHIFSFTYRRTQSVSVDSSCMLCIICYTEIKNFISRRYVISNSKEQSSLKATCLLGNRSYISHIKINVCSVYILNFQGVIQRSFKSRESDVRVIMRQANMNTKNVYSGRRKLQFVCTFHIHSYPHQF